MTKKAGKIIGEKELMTIFAIQYIHIRQDGRIFKESNQRP